VFTEKTREHGWATMERETWEEQIVSHDDLGQFTNRVPTVDDVMTLSILEATKDSRPRLGAS
jgi:NitT/TauT family transport system substrate-binding protein